MTKAKEPIGRTEHRARVLVAADLSSMAAAAKRHGIRPETIKSWRQELDTNDVLAREYAKERALVQTELRAPMVETIHAALARMREVMPSVSAKDIQKLTNVARDLSEIVVQGDATVPPRKDKPHGVPPHGAHPPGAAPAEGAGEDPLH